MTSQPGKGVVESAVPEGEGVPSPLGSEMGVDPGRSGGGGQAPGGEAGAQIGGAGLEPDGHARKALAGEERQGVVGPLGEG